MVNYSSLLAKVCKKRFYHEEHEGHEEKIKKTANDKRFTI